VRKDLPPEAQLLAHQSLARAACLAALLAAVGGFSGASSAHAQIGTPVEDLELHTLAGGRETLLGKDVASVLAFFRPQQERSREALKGFSSCRRAFAGRPVRWVAVVSNSASAEAARGLVRDIGLDVPVLVDEGDLVYGRLGIAMHPVVVIVGTDRRLAAFEPFRAIDYCARVSARLRRVLGDISEAQMQRLLDPPRAVEGGDAQVARRRLALAEMLFKAGSAPKALENVRESLARDPELAPAHALLGRILAAQGSCAEAVPSFRRALEIDPQLAEAREGLRQCEIAAGR